MVDVDIKDNLFSVVQSIFIASIELGEGVCNATDVDVEVECLVKFEFVWKCWFAEYDAVEEDEDGLSADAGNELTSTAESGVSGRCTFVLSGCEEVVIVSLQLDVLF